VIFLGSAEWGRSSEDFTENDCTGILLAGYFNVRLSD